MSGDTTSRVIALAAFAVSLTTLIRSIVASRRLTQSEKNQMRNAARQGKFEHLTRIDFLLTKYSILSDSLSSRVAAGLSTDKTEEATSLRERIDRRIESLEKSRSLTLDDLQMLASDDQMSSKSLDYFRRVVASTLESKVVMDGHGFDELISYDEKRVAAL